MKILLTGGAGFIGSHIAKKYLESGHKLFILDKKKRSPSFIFQNSKSKIQNNLNYIQFHFPQDNLENLFAKIKPDIINHHAALISVSQSLKNPVKYSQTNVLFTAKLLELAEKYKTKHFIFASSAAVYGDCQKLPIKENYSKIPLSIYAGNKLSSELLIKLYSKKFKTLILRYSNVCGPGQGQDGEGGVISNFCQSYMKNIKPIVFGSGQQTRDFIFVEDVAQANLLATQKKLTGIFNLSSQKETTIIDLIKKLNKITGKDLKPIFKPKKKEDIKKSLLDNYLIKQKLNWQPEFTLKKGLEETIRYFNN